MSSFVTAVDGLLAFVVDKTPPECFVLRKELLVRFEELDRNVWAIACRHGLESKLPPQTLADKWDYLGKTNLPGTKYGGFRVAPGYIIRSWRNDLLALRALAKQGAKERTSETSDQERTAVPKVLTAPDPKRVFVIYGQNIAAYNELCKFLRSLKLDPKSFFDVSNELHGSPTVLEIIRHGMNQAAGVLALFTPDEWANLRPELAQAGAKGEGLCRWQARPNVIFEAGLAMGVDAARTIFVRLGSVSLFSDVGGIHAVHLDNTPDSRHLLRGRLKAAGCRPNMRSSDYLDPGKSGDFAICLKKLRRKTPADPFGHTSTNRSRRTRSTTAGAPYPPGHSALSQRSTKQAHLSETEYKVLVAAGKQQLSKQHATARNIASVLEMSEETAKYYLDELSRKYELLNWFGNMDRSIPDRYELTHEGRRLLVERGVI